jgi:hypothetical protein
MWARFFKFISTNLLIAGSIAAFVGTVAGTWFVAWKAPDVGGALGDLGRWLRAPAVSTRVDEITLALVAILLGFIISAALFLREARKQQRRQALLGLSRPPHAEGRAIPDDFVPTDRQAWAGHILLRHDPDPVDLDVVFDGIRRIHLSQHPKSPLFRAQVARDLEQLIAAGMVRNAGSERVYALTKPGRDWLLEAQDVPWQRP